MKLATTTGDFQAYTKNQDYAISEIKRAGFKYVDYSFIMDYKNNNGIFGENFDEHIESMKRLSDKLQVKFVQSHSPMGDPLANNTAFIEATNKCIVACAKLGIKNLVVHSGYEKGISKEENFYRNKEFYEKLFPTAEKYEVNILTENFNKMFDPQIYWMDNAKDLREFIDFVDHPLFHCCWDTGHANLQEMPQDEELRILGKDVYALHVQDNHGRGDYHMAPFFGSLNLDCLMHGLENIGYNGYFTFEADSMLCASYRKRIYDKDSRLLVPPIDIKRKTECLLYDIGKHILTSYNCFDE